MKSHRKDKASKVLAKRQRELANMRGLISPAPGAKPVRTTALEAVGWADAACRAGDLVAASHLCGQLANNFGLVREPCVITLKLALAMRRSVEAMDSARRLLQDGVSQSADLGLVAQAFELCGHAEEALAMVDRALREAATDVPLRKRRAALLMQLNRRDEAVAEARRILRIRPGDPEALRWVAAFGELTDAELRELEGRAYPPAEQPDAFAALAAAHRRRGDRAAEMACLERAHAAVARTSAGGWSREESDTQAAAIMQVFDADFFAGRHAVSASEQRPIFVVGMPRSGSTLTEQILSAADGVASLGETSVWAWLVADLAREKYGGAPYPALASILEPDDLRRLQARYLEGVARAFTPARVFVDKSLNNYMYVGLLSLVFPNASFVYPVRDPLDTVLSCYQQVLLELDHALTLEELAVRYRNTARVMTHWQRVLPGRVHALDYAALVEDPEGEAQKLLEFCGLPWDPKVLRFHESSAPVRTPSLEQVRQPIYTSAVSKWHAYAAWLEPARAVLAG